MKKLSKLISLMLSVVLCIGMAAPAFAIKYNIADGDVHIENDDKGVFSYQIKADDLRSDNTYKTDEDPDIIITGTTQENTITVGENVKDTTITLENVNIDVSATGDSDSRQAGEAALSITGERSNVIIKLEGENTLKSGVYHAGLELSDGASVTVDSAGALTAEGGFDAAGIGSGWGSKSKAGAITISGSGKVTAKAIFGGAGIGSGFYGTVGNITISTNGSGSVNATGGHYGGAGIGSGSAGKAGNITICGTAKVTATGRGDAGIGAGAEGTVGTVINRVEEGHDYKVETKPASCTEDGETTYTCGICGHSYTEEGDPATGHNYTSEITKEATCTEDGVMTYTCVKGDDSYTKAIPANGHGEGVWTVTTPAGPGVEGEESLICPDCGMVLGTRPIPALPVPAIPDDGGADAAPDAATIGDQEVPLAGLTPLYMLLEELRQHEEIPEAELPEDFKWIDHEYAQAIYWGLQEELVVDTEEEPLDPDEVLTVGRMREVLVNFVERYLGLDNFVVTLAGEDDEIVMDLGERLTAFYAELEAALEAQEDKAA